MRLMHQLCDIHMLSVSVQNMTSGFEEWHRAHPRYVIIVCCRCAYVLLVLIYPSQSAPGRPSCPPPQLPALCQFATSDEAGSYGIRDHQRHTYALALHSVLSASATEDINLHPFQG